MIKVQYSNISLAAVHAGVAHQVVLHELPVCDPEFVASPPGVCLVSLSVHWLFELEGEGRHDLRAVR
jgi:hypothetical protein